MIRGNRGGWTHNKRVNPTVRPVTVHAKNARPAPSRPAGYAQRYAYTIMILILTDR